MHRLKRSARLGFSLGSSPSTTAAATADALSASSALRTRSVLSSSPCAAGRNLGKSLFSRARGAGGKGLLVLEKQPETVESSLNWELELYRPTRRNYNTEAATPQAAETIPEGQRYAFWLNNVYPVKRNRIDLRAWLVGNYERKIHSVFPPDAQIELMQRVIKEGGVYAHFVTEAGVTMEEHAAKMLKYLREHPRRMYPFATGTPKAYLVKGKPFIEDISARLPSSKLNVQFKGPDILLDDLYRLFRPYGKIRDMEIPKGQPKDELRSAVIQMETVEGAISARNCLHNLQLNNTTILISYEKFQPISYLQGLFTRHPRIMFPIVGIAATGTTYLLFDPLRIYSIYKRRLMKQHPMSGWSRREKETAQVAEAALVKEAVSYRTDTVKKLQNHFKQQPNAVLAITAPPGSGLSPTVKGGLVGRRKTIIVHCDGIPTIEAFIEEFCSSVAFAPSFYYLNQVGTYIDALIPSSKNFFSQTPVVQMQSVLLDLRYALRRAALIRLPNEEDDQYPVIVFDGLQKMIKSMGGETAENVIDLIFSWATEIACKNKYAHVAFVSDDVFAPAILRKHVELAGGRVDYLTLDDIPAKTARVMIVEKLKAGNITLSDEAMDYTISAIGGRMMDIDLFCRKVKSGLSAHDAISQMASEAINIIRDDGFDQKDNTTLDPKAKTQPPAWLKSQLWDSIQRIAQKDKVDYDELLYTSFNGDEKALHALVKANLLRITYKNSNKIESVTAFSPLYGYAFKKLVSNPKMSAGIGIVVKKFEIEQETTKMNKILDEMVKLRSLVYKGYLWGDVESDAVSRRRKMMESKLDEFNAKLEKLEKQLSDLNNLQSSLKWK